MREIIMQFSFFVRLRYIETGRRPRKPNHCMNMEDASPAVALLWMPSPRCTLSLGSNKSPHVPGQYRGYSLQADRVLAALLSTGPGAKVSLEVFEDVGAEDGSGEKTAIQTKSALTGNPVGDRSDKLWKAFANWMDACETGELDPDCTKFVIFVSAPKEVNIAQSFSDAQSEGQASILIANAESKLLGKEPAGKILSASARKYADPVFDHQLQRKSTTLLPKYAKKADFSRSNGLAGLRAR
jgi:hypothetical protein